MKFELNLEHFSEFKKSLLMRTIPLMLMPLVAVLVFTKSTMIMVPFFLLIVLFVIMNLIKKQKRAWETFELSIDESKIERSQEGYPTISITKTDIKEAILAKNGSITLVAQPNANSIIIPFSVNNKEELLQIISSFTTVRELKKNNSLLYMYGAGILSLIALFSFMLSTNFYLTIGLGVVLLIFNIWSFIQIQRNKNLDKKVKRASYFMIFMLIVIVGKLMATLS